MHPSGIAGMSLLAMDRTCLGYQLPVPPAQTIGWSALKDEWLTPLWQQAFCRRLTRVRQSSSVPAAFVTSTNRSAMAFHVVRSAGRVAPGGSGGPAHESRLGPGGQATGGRYDYPHKDRIVLVMDNEHPPPVLAVMDYWRDSCDFGALTSERIYKTKPRMATGPVLPENRRPWLPGWRGVYPAFPDRPVRRQARQVPVLAQPAGDEPPENSDAPTPKALGKHRRWSTPG